MALEKEQTVEPKPTKLVYTAQEAADALGICLDSVYRLIKRGHLRSSNVLRTKIIPKAELDRFLRATLN
jgi:excisionase family DNA binding protein